MSLRVSSAGTPVLLTGVFSALIAISGCGNEQSDLSDYRQSTGTSGSHGSLPSSVAATTHKTSPSLPATSPQVPPSAPPAPPPPPLPPPPPALSPPPTTGTPTSTIKRPASPFNLDRKTLPAYAYQWTKDRYQDFDYSDRCVFPSEVDTPSRKLTYGTMLDELFSIRDLIRDKYIFFDEVVDLDPRNFVEPFNDFDDHYNNMTDKDSYFQQLRSQVKLEDGLSRHGLFEVSKDNKVHLPPFRKTEYSFGIKWDKRSETPPRNYVVRHVTADSPGKELLNGSPKVKRGDKLVKVNDIDFISVVSDESVKKIERALSPYNRSTVTKFEFIDRDSKKVKTIFLNPTADIGDGKGFSRMITTESGKVGYIYIGNNFWKFAHLYEAIKEFREYTVKDVILDIRYYNRQEDYWRTSRSEPMLLYTILGKENTDGKLFRRMDTKKTGERHPFFIPFFSECNAQTEESQKKELCDDLMETVKRDCLGLPYFWRSCIPLDKYSFDLQSLNLGRIYLLASEETCHIGELIINGLLGIDVEVVLVGGQTCGIPYYASDYYKCGINYRVVNTHYLNDKKIGDYVHGFKPQNTRSEYGVEVPGCFVEDDFTNDLGDKEERLLATALQYRQDGTCPAVE